MIGIVDPRGAFPMQRTPVELFLEIIAMLGEDKFSLSACRLVSKRWREVANPHLFATLTVVTTDPVCNVGAFCEFVDPILTSRSGSEILHSQEVPPVSQSPASCRIYQSLARWLRI
ncbi:hypothetical protein C8T65DRAFT_73626 [Cerioporus squamosus]|nr:hypothetical protein C8T65DRAFT_73626 [Cerioporus squamosus]